MTSCVGVDSRPISDPDTVTSVPPDWNIRCRKIALCLLLASAIVTGLATLLAIVATDITKDAARYLGPTTLDASATLVSIGSAVDHAAGIVNYTGLVLTIAAALLTVATMVGDRRARTAKAPTADNDLGRQVDELVGSLEQMRVDAAETQSRADEAERRHRENLALLDVSREQAKAIRGLLRSEARSDKRLQMWLFAGSAVLAIALFVTAELILR